MTVAKARKRALQAALDAGLDMDTAFAVAARDGDRRNVFAARDPGALADPCYDRIVHRLDGLAQDYETELKKK